MGEHIKFWTVLSGAVVACGAATQILAQEHKPTSSYTTTAFPGTVALESGKPAADMRIISPRYADAETTTDAKGKFVLRLPPGSQGPLVMAQSFDGQLLGISSDHEPRQFLRIIAKPKKIVRCFVTDPQGEPIPDVDVSILVRYLPLVAGKTDATGRCLLEYPADANVQWVFAKKSKVGSDYFENYLSWPTTEFLELPREVKLILNGAKTAKVSVRDSMDRPVEKIGIHPWLIEKQGKLSDCNIGGLFIDESFSSRTDAMGNATIDWLPADQTRRVTMLARDVDYFAGHHHLYDPDNAEQPVVIQIRRLARVSGKVKLPDGSAAAGISLQAESNGNRYFRGHAKTDRNGKYEFKIHPDQLTTIAIADPDWGAKSLTGISLPPAEAKDDSNFTLGIGTLIHGQITAGPDREPVNDGNATLVEITGGGRLVRWSYPDEFGHYSFRVGPGEYQLHLPHKEWSDVETLKVADEREFVRNGHLAKPSRDTLVGTVSDSRGNPIAGCELHGQPAGAGHAGFHARTDDQGRFRTERWTDDTILLARSAELNLAAVRLILELERDITLSLEPAATVSGSIRTHNGAAVTDIRVSGVITSDFHEKAIRVFTESNGNGEFSFRGIPLRTKLQLQVLHNGKWHQGPSLNVIKAADIHVKDFVLEKPN